MQIVSQVVKKTSFSTCSLKGQSFFSVVSSDQEKLMGDPVAIRAAKMATNNTRKPQHKPISASSQIDRVVASVEDATKRLSQHSQISNSSKMKAENKIGPWRLGRTLGKGSTGRVRLAKNSKTGQLAAIKIIPKVSNSGSNASSSLPHGIEREIIIMKLIQHPNIMSLYDVWENDKELFLVLEYVQGGELFDFIISNGKLSESDAVKYFSMIISGVSYCHQFNISHRDLKPENILLDTNGNVKIADFGMAIFETNLLETSCGSPHYASPEIVMGKNYHGSPSDVWSCGVILFALLTGYLPFDDKSIRKLLMKVQSGKFMMPSSLSLEAKDLISKMLRVNPNDRIPISEIKNHPLMKKYKHLIPISSNGYNFETNFDLNKPIPNINSDILHNLQTLWHGKPKSRIILMLKMDKPNNEKLFYHLLSQYQKNNSLPSLPSVKKLNTSSSSSASTFSRTSKIPRSTTIKTLIQDENGKTLDSDFKTINLTPNGTHKRKLKPIVASSSKKSFNSSKSLSIINMNVHLGLSPKKTNTKIAPLNNVKHIRSSNGTIDEEDLTQFKYLVNTIFESPTKQQQQQQQQLLILQQQTNANSSDISISKLDQLKLDLKQVPKPSSLKRITTSSTKKLSNYLIDPNDISINEFNLKVSKEKHHTRLSSFDTQHFSIHEGIQVSIKSPIVEKFELQTPSPLLAPVKQLNKVEVVSDVPSAAFESKEPSTLPRGRNITPKQPPIVDVTKYNEQAPNSNKPAITKHSDGAVKSWFKRLFKSIKKSTNDQISSSNLKFPNQGKIAKYQRLIQCDTLTRDELIVKLLNDAKFEFFKITQKSKNNIQIEKENFKLILEINEMLGYQYGFGGCIIKVKLYKGEMNRFDQFCLLLDELINNTNI